MPRGRYFSARDVRMFNSINGELMKNIIEQVVVLYRVNPYETDTHNVYGESMNKVYYPGIEMTCLVDTDPESVAYELFGPDVKKDAVFKFHQKLCEIKGIYPQVGDFVAWETAYFELSEIAENQYLGGQPEKNFSLVAASTMTRVSRLNISERQQ